MAVVAAPEVERSHGLSHTTYTVAIFSIPLLLSAGIEACLSIASDRLSRRRFLVGGLFALASALVLAAWAPSVGWLTAALALAGAASGACCGAAQAELVRRGDAERALARWTLFGSLGDALTPPLIAAASLAGGSYRSAFGSVALLVALLALRVACGPTSDAARSGGGAEPAEEPPTPNVLEALRHGVRNGRLWLWLGGVACCTLLDELVAALLALRLEQDLGAGAGMVTTSLTALSGGAAAGAVLTERLLSTWSSRKILLGSAVVCALAVAAAALSPAGWTVLLAAAVLGATAAAHYPLLLARAYAEVPRSPGLVNALGQVFVISDLGVPLLVGALADRWGLGVALLCLLLQPLTVGALAVCLAGRPAASAPSPPASA